MKLLICVLMTIGHSSTGYAEGTDASPWKWAGDLRLRLQAEKNGDRETRWLERLRVRFGVAVQVEPELKAEIRLATAKGYQSANQNLGDNADPGAPRRFIGLDLAYLEWSPAFFFKASGGRIPQLHYRPGASQLLLDENIALEGAGLVLDWKGDDGLRAVLNAGSVILRENYDSYYSMANSNNNLNWTQLRLEWTSGRYRALIGGGFFNYTSLQGKNFADLAAGAAPRGNSEDPAGVVKYPYLARDYFVEGGVPVGPVDLGLFAQRVINNEAPQQNAAWWVGINLGQKSWDSQIAYSETQPDAIPAYLTWGDFAGGTTDARGMVYSFRWKFRPGLSLKLSQFINRTQASMANKEYNRTHIDFSASF